MIITIDGPAAAGKSTVSRKLAERLGFDFLDTGATYRAATWKALQEDVDFSSRQELAGAARNADIKFKKQDGERRVICDGQDVTQEIRKPEITARVKPLADEPAARRALIEKQRAYARDRDIVAEGRDQGTEVFPDADVKFYLDASEETRARRRLKDRSKDEHDARFEEVLTDIQARDQADSIRPVGRLQRTEDMIFVDSTNLSVDQVVDRMVEAVHSYRKKRSQDGERMEPGL
ncbi:MAG: (d)CMP kinase [Candidatus Brocadiia bacterium]|nr:(d)CMP kinase [Planctomycetota bacterium]